MALQQYEQNSLLFNTNFLDTFEDMTGYRGELVLIEGEVADEQGRTKPPVAIMRHAIMLEANDQLILVSGIIDQLELLENFIEKYKEDFAPGIRILLYVVNLTEPVQLEKDGFKIVLIPLTEGVAWNELVDELCLEKSDFKGQKPVDKIATVYNEFKTYAPNFPTVDYVEALTKTADIKRESYGAV